MDIVRLVIEVINGFFSGIDIKVIISVCIIIIFGWVLTRVVKLIFKKVNKNDVIHLRFARSIINGIITIYTLYQAGMQIDSLHGFITTVLASTSLLVVVAGFAAQEALSNVINGLFISIFRPFEIGDRVKLVSSNLSGYIEDISLRHTIIRTFTNSRVIVPNSVMNKELLENSYYKDSRASMWMDVTIGYNSDIKLAKKIMADVIGSHALYLDIRSDEDKKIRDKVVVMVRELGASGISLRATVWTLNIDDNFKACSDIRERIKEEFDKNGIEIPYNKLDVNINNNQYEE